jgi:enoyl-CoA hydratase/carnithine racemase
VVKRIIRAFVADPSDDRFPDVHDLAIGCFQTEDHREGARAFMEKRAPVLCGR